MEKFICMNYNPDQKRTGDCVLRAIAAFEHFEIKKNDEGIISSAEIYKRIKSEILEHGSYELQLNFEKYLSKHNYVRINTYRWIDNIDLRTVNQLATFCKNFNLRALALTNNHMVYVDPEGVIDTWDSRRKRLESFYVKEEDIKKLGVTLLDEADHFTDIKYVDTKENVIRYNKVNDRTYRQIRLK